MKTYNKKEDSKVHFASEKKDALPMEKKLSPIKITYFITMGLILFTVIFNIYCLLHFSYNKTFYAVINTVTPIITLIYLILVIKNKKALLKKIDEAIHKIFSKN